VGRVLWISRMMRRCGEIGVDWCCLVWNGMAKA
jgi:hypothetical protein